MFEESPDIDRARLAAVLDAEWGVSAATLRYEPVGFGTHHYVADHNGTRWFVNVHDLSASSWIAPEPSGAFAALDRAFETTLVLRRAGLEFVHGPRPSSAGRVLVALDDRYAVSVFGFVDGTSNDDGEFASDDERRLVLNALGRMHDASDRVPRELPRRDTLAVPQRAPLFATLDELDEPWNGGPFSEPTRELIASHADSIRDRFDRYDDLVRHVRGTDRRWVVTHGEPHGSNIMRTTDGGLLLIDWDTVAIAPPERDLWHVALKSHEDLAAYASGGGTANIDPNAMALYYSWWSLAEIAEYTLTLRGPHIDDANVRTAWENLGVYVKED